MRRILAIASISMRTAFRSKVFLTLLALLVLVIVGIPLTIKGDGTLSGYVRILIEYTLNFVRFILAAAAIWSGCAAISQEVESRQIQMTATKPIHPISIWIGKWLGIIAPIAVLMLLSGAIVYAILLFNTRPSQLDQSEQVELRKDILVGRREIMPRAPKGLDADVERAVQQVLEHGDLPQHVTESQLRKSLRSTLITRRQTVDPEQTLQWKFEATELPEDKTATLECKPSSSAIGGVLLPGRIRLLDQQGKVLHEQQVELTTETENRIDLPGDVLAGRAEVAVEFKNLSEDHTAIFPDQDSVTLLAYAGGFELNYVRTILIMISQLALLTAIAVTMGAIFSTPVAAFVSIFMLVVVFMDGYIAEMAQKKDYSGGGHSHGHTEQVQEAQGPGPIDGLLHGVFVTIDFTLGPLRQPNVLQNSSTGIYVSWHVLANSVLFHVIVYGGAFAVIGASIFKRRELALPQR